MEFFRKGNFQTVYYEEKQYFRLEYTDELWYAEWWYFDDSDTILKKIEDKKIFKSLEESFSDKYSDMTYVNIMFK